MPKHFKDYMVIGLCGTVLLGFSLGGLLLPDAEASQTERRRLAQFPECSLRTVTDGSFMSGFEDYALDQFPLRDSFRTLKARVSLSLMRKQDNHDLYFADGFVSKLDYPLSEASVTYATDVFRNVYDRYLKESDCQTYLSIIPDKNYFLAEENGYPALDYDALVAQTRKQMPYATYIDIFEKLDIDDYYRTDTHWKQEALDAVAITLTAYMNAPYTSNHSTVSIGTPFYGVYYGQAALPMEPDSMCKIVKPCHDRCTVTDLETNSEMDFYNMEKLQEADPYEMYLSGSKSLIHIENPSAKSERQLILFRDSYGSSLAPYFTSSYRSIYLVDIRYLHPNLLGSFIDFSDSDVLFLYSSMMLNNSETLKK